jgi:dTDP-4-dehydrorhamnose reductase
VATAETLGLTGMRWLVTGAAGQVGTEVVERLRRERPDDPLVAADRRALDITDAGSVARAVEQARPDVVVNCAAYTDVDGAETDEATATAVNGAGPGHLAAACARSSARLIHLSTDYVFDGTATSPIPETADVAPASAYGRSKAAGERAVLAAHGPSYVVRTAWVYGRTGGNFVKTMARLATDRDRVDVVADQHGSPTWSADLAGALVALGGADPHTCPPGIWHFTNAGATTWYDFARAVFAGLGHDPDRVRPTTTANFPRPAPRPAYSVLSTTKWERHPLPPCRPWGQALDEALPRILGG